MTASRLAAQPTLSETTRTIRVTGVGEVMVQPDLATLQFAVETTGLTAREAGAANADLMDVVIQALTREGVSRQDIQTSGYSLFPEYAPPMRGNEADAPRITGYRAMNQVSVRTRRLDQVGTLIDAGLAAGANRLNGVGFELRDSGEAESRALEMAVERARQTAQTMASALQVNLGPIIDASTNPEPPRPMYRAVGREMMAMDAAAVTPIEPGEQTVRATASLVFEIR
jgi:uncharacterized protein YggE